MYSLIVSLIAAAVSFLSLILLFDKWSAILVAPVVGIATYILVVRRIRRKVEATTADLESHIKGQRFEKAIQLLQTLRPYYRWQPLLTGSIEGQIGMIKYAYLMQFEDARPFLEQAHPWFWQPRAMLAAGHFKKKRYAEMEATLEKTLKRNGKEAFLWALYAWCQWKRGLQDKAIEVLARGSTALPSDERLKTMSLSLANDKRIKMTAFGAEWVSLHLEQLPPAQQQQQQQMLQRGGRRGFTPPPQVYGRGAFRRR